MPRVSDVYAGAYLNASELAPLGQRRFALIHHVAQELVGQNRDPKLVLNLVSASGKSWPKEVVLNKGNALQLQAAYGDDTDHWAGKRIEIWAENVQFQGRIVPGIKVLPASSQQPPATAPYAASPGSDGQLRGSMQPGPLVYPPPSNAPPGDDLDDAF